MSGFLPYKDTALQTNFGSPLAPNITVEFNPDNYNIGVAKDIRNIQESFKKKTDEEKSGIYTADTLIKRNISGIPAILDPILPQVGVAAMAGGSDTGKSSLLREFSIHVVAGTTEYLGFKLNATHRRAIYVSTEDDDTAISFLLKKANSELKFKTEQLQGLTFIFETTNLIKILTEELSANPVDLIVIDAFTDLYGKAINETNQVRTFLNQYSQLAQRYKCLIIFLHHTGKRTEDLIPSKNNLLGSQGFEAKMRAVLELRLDSIDANKRHLCFVKGNYVSREYKTESFVLNFTENLLFTNTGERRPFDELKASNKSNVKEQVHELTEVGKTQNEISKITGLSQSTVSRYLKG